LKVASLDITILGKSMISEQQYLYEPAYEYF